jgi:hypothetical protein
VRALILSRVIPAVEDIGSIQGQLGVDMASILEFRTTARANAQADKPARERGNTADIVIFPGIRYDRWADDADAEAATDPSMELRRDSPTRDQ